MGPSSEYQGQDLRLMECLFNRQTLKKTMPRGMHRKFQALNKELPQDRRLGKRDRLSPGGERSELTG